MNASLNRKVSKKFNPKRTTRADHMSGEARAETMTRPPLLPPHLGDALEYIYENDEADYRQAAAYSAAYDPRYFYGPQPGHPGFRPGYGYGYGWGY